MCHRSLAVSGPEHAVGSTRSLRQLLTLIAPERNTKSMDRDSKRAGEDEIMKEEEEEEEANPEWHWEANRKPSGLCHPQLVYRP